MAWDIEFYRSADGSAPGKDFLLDCPTKVRASFFATLSAVRNAPPPAFSGGGKWEAMHGSMGGYYEIRLTGPGRKHYRLFCVLENGATSELRERGFDGPRIVVINGMVKPNATKFTDSEYRKQVRRLGDDYSSRLPRPVQ